jgi:hypothetical protein
LRPLVARKERDIQDEGRQQALESFREVEQDLVINPRRMAAGLMLSYWPTVTLQYLRAPV